MNQDVSIEDVRQALSFVSPESRDTWVAMAFAVKSEFGDEGFSTWDDWSQGGSTYSAKSARDVWRSAKAGGRVGIGSLFKAAQEAGYRFAPRSDDDKKRLESESAARRAKR